MFFAGLVFGNGADRAGIFAGNNVFDNGRIGADIMAAAAFDAEILINESLAVYETDGVFRAVNLAGAGNAGAAEIADNITFFAAGHAGGVDNRDFARLQFFAFESLSGIVMQRPLAAFFFGRAETEDSHANLADNVAVVFNIAMVALGTVGQHLGRNVVYVSETVGKKTGGNPGQNVVADGKKIVFGG